MKFDLSFNPPVMNAAGSLGFAPGARQQVAPANLGAFVTNPVSLGRRDPAQSRATIGFPGGFILHSGYPNPGLKAVIHRHAASWKRASIPVIVHLLAQIENDIATMVRMLENVEGVSALEVGLPPEADSELAARMIQAGAGELPVVARLPLERALELGAIAIKAGAAAISLGPPRGALLDPDGKLLRGRLYGPALFPLALANVLLLAENGVPVVGACGVYRSDDVEAMLTAGALAVQIDTALWRGWS